MNIRFINPNDENTFIEAMIKILIPHQKQSITIHNAKPKPNITSKNKKVDT